LAVRTTSIDLGADKFLAEVAALKGQSVEVGVQADAGNYKGGGRRSPKIVVIASTHEFGTKSAGKNRNVTVPKRSFIASTVDEKDNAWFRESESIVNNIIAGSASAKGLLASMGLRIETDIKNKIRSGIKPKLKKPTIKRTGKPRKGEKRKRPVPLWDTGQLINSIRYISSLGG
jgi:phage gpG-like protein